MKSIAERMFDAQEEIPSAPPRFEEARQLVRDALDIIADTAIPDETVAAVLLSEAMPRIVGCYGPERTAVLLMHLSKSLMRTTHQ